MESEGSLLFSQKPATGYYPEPDESSPHLPIHYIILPPTPRSSSGLFHSSFPTKILYIFLNSPMHAPCPANLFLLYLIILIYYVKHIICEAPHYTVFSSLQPLIPS
jgi:hypothetical protein